jgi:hypothetical protein
MRRLATPLTAAVVATVAVLATPCAASELTRFVEFFAGCRLLEQVSVTDPSRATAAFASLVKHTGMTPDRAVRFVERYRRRPGDWKKVLALVTAELEKRAEKE